MFGTRESPQLKVKAAEAFGLLVFLENNMSKFAVAFGANLHRWHEAARMLLRYLQICRSYSLKLPTSAQQDFHVGERSIHSTLSAV